VLICLLDVYKQGFCKAVDLLSMIVMFLGGPFCTTLVLLHVYARNINNVLERTVWQKHKSYNEYLEDHKSNRSTR
jgi:hypothetical protein